MVYKVLAFLMVGAVLIFTPALGMQHMIGVAVYQGTRSHAVGTSARWHGMAYRERGWNF
jgi:hypothetical protein